LALSALFAHPIHRALEDPKRAREKVLSAGNAAKVVSLTKVLWGVDHSLSSPEVKQAGILAKQLKDECFTAAEVWLHGS
jgi:hypothetical protein